MMLWLITAIAADWGPPPQNPVVKSVYDGDTLTLENGDKVRLSWVNTPELRPSETFGIEARDAARALVLGRPVQLILQGENPRDGYGRLLAGVMADGHNLSLELVEQGLAHVFVIPPEAFDMSPLLAAQSKARAAKLGIWSTPEYSTDIHITSFHANARGDDKRNVNGESLRVVNLDDQPIDTIGWTLSTRAGRVFPLPSVEVPPGHTVQVHAGHGATRSDPGRQLAIHLGSDVPIFDDQRDRVTIYDRYDRPIATRDHGR